MAFSFLKAKKNVNRADDDEDECKLGLRSMTTSRSHHPKQDQVERLSAVEAEKQKRLKSFLERHGFVDEESPRISSGYGKIRIQPVYPIDVARQLGDTELEELLLAGSRQKARAMSGGQPRVYQEGLDLVVSTEPLRRIEL